MYILQSADVSRTQYSRQTLYSSLWAHDSLSFPVTMFTANKNKKAKADATAASKDSVPLGAEPTPTASVAQEGRAKTPLLAEETQADVAPAVPVVDPVVVAPAVQNVIVVSEPVCEQAQQQYAVPVKVKIEQTAEPDDNASAVVPVSAGACVIASDGVAAAAEIIETLCQLREAPVVAPCRSVSCRSVRSKRVRFAYNSRSDSDSDAEGRSRSRSRERMCAPQSAPVVTGYTSCDD